MIGIVEAAERIERQAWADLVDSAADLGAEVHHIGSSMALVSPAIDSVLLNRAFGVGAEEALEVLRTYRRAGVPRYFIHRAAEAADPSVTAKLVAMGLSRYHRSWIKLALSGDLTPPAAPACPFEVTPARPADADAVGHILAAGFDMPAEAAPAFSRLIGREHWRVFVARDDGAPVAAGVLFVSDGMGYLAAASTKPTHRRRGAQAALMAERIRVAVELGCRVITSETGERVPGEPNSSNDNMIRFGLRPICRRDNWAPTGIRWALSG